MSILTNLEVDMLMHLVAAASICVGGSCADSGPVTFCRILAAPSEFDEQKVTIRASYRYGFEWQELFCAGCAGSARVWLELGDEPPNALVRQLRRLPKNQGTINATFRGVFRGKPGAYGDGSYRFQLELTELRDVEIVSKSGAMPDTLPAAERRRLYCCGTCD